MAQSISKPRPPQLTISGVLEDGMSINRPVTPASEIASPGLGNQRSLKQLWNEADKKFFKETGYHLESPSPIHKDGVLQKWEARYSREKTEMQNKLDKLAPVLQKIVNGVEVVGAFAASAASAVFGPSQMCFNALLFVLDAPGKIKHVYDTLAELFLEVQDFLLKYKVLDRIDSEGGLPSELVENANRLLIAFIRICGIACRLLKEKRKVWYALEAVFLSSDGGVSAALADFKALAETQAQVVGIISLEHVLKSESLSRQILAGQMEISLYFRAQASRENDEKTKIITKERLATIERILLSHSESALMSQPRQPLDLVPGTLDALISAKEYVAWADSDTGGQNVLHLSGASGTGKTSLVDSLRDSLQVKRSKMLTSGPSLYVCNYNFSDRKIATSPKKVIQLAFKVMAFQVAQQSTRYSDKLSNSETKLEDLTKKDDEKEVWKALGLFDFNPPDHSVLYMLFDGFTDDIGLKLINNLTTILLANRPSNSKFKILILFAGNTEAIPHRHNAQDIIRAEEVNEHIMRAFIDKQFETQDCFQDQDAKTKARKQQFTEQLLQRVKGNFDAARQKVSRIRSALDDDDLTSTHIETIIEQDLQIGFDEEARDVLNAVAKSLTSKRLEQLQQLLALTLYGWPGEHLLFTLSVLEALVNVNRKEETLEPLAKKVAKRFSKVFHVQDEYLWIKDDIEDYLRSNNEKVSISHGDDARLISLTINVQNAKKSELQHFLLDLNARLAYDTSIFTEPESISQDCSVRIPETEARLNITLMCLRALNEELPEDAKLALNYAFSNLPYHLTQLLRVRSELSIEDRKQVCEGLVTFLAEPYYLEQAHENEGRYVAFYWFTDGDGPGTIREWLSDEDVLVLLQATPRRWIRRARSENDERPDYLKQVAMVIAQEWKQVGKIRNRGRFPDLCTWIAGYVTSLNIKETTDDDTNLVNAQSALQSSGEQLLADHDLREDPETSKMEHPNSTTATEQAHSEQILSSQDGLDVNSGSGNDSALSSTVVQHEIEEAHEGPNENDELSAGVQSVLVASEWLKCHILDGKEDENFNYRVALTLMDMYEHTTAKKWYLKIQPDNPYYWRACITVAEILGIEKAYEDSGKVCEKGLDIARTRRQQGGLNELETSMYMKGLTHMVDLFADELEQLNQATKYLKEVLEVEKVNGERRWLLIRMLCSQGQDEEASTVLEEWLAHPDRFGDQHPRDALIAVAAADEGAVNLAKLMKSVQVENKDLRVQLLLLLTDAASQARRKGSQLAELRLLYQIAGTPRSAPEGEYIREAVRNLEECLEIEVDVNEGGNAWDLADAQATGVRLICFTKFETLRQGLTRDPLSPTSISHEDIRTQMRNDVKRLVAICPTHSFNFTCYEVALCMAMDRRDWAQEVLRQEIVECVDILSDDTPDNDPMGGRRLARAFCFCRDDVNMRVAFSLLDRQARIKALKQTVNALENVNDVEQSSGGSADPEHPNINDEEYLDESWDRMCDICRKEIVSSDPDGFWICRFCDTVDLCTECCKAFSKGEAFFERCQPDHDFVHFYHPECSMEELVDNKVFIPMSIAHNEDGSFVREGGRLADLSEWVETIKREWNLPTAVNESRIQR